jgi:YYY domain-containing protein
VRFFELLFAGDLGYRLERVFASRPRLLGIELYDDFADESFSVYDHPKTLVFRNVERLSAGELEQRLNSASPSLPVSRSAMLAAGAEALPGTPAAAGFVESSTVGACLWTAALVAISASGGRLVATALPGSTFPAAAALGRVAGVVLFAYPVWLAASLGFVRFSFPALLGCAALLVGIARRTRPVERGLAERVAFYGAFGFFLVARAFQPEIFWGEKPMDFSFLNSLYRATALPPPEPWMSGRTINYPYFGHFWVAALGKLACVSPALAFNLGVATTGALTSAAAFGLGTLLSGRVAGGAAASALVAFAGNLAGLPEFFRRGTADFHTFWATSRVIENTINEFPLWSFLFADLHAHVMAMPLSLLFTALAARIASAGASPALLALASLVLGAVATTSTWSFPVQAGAAGGLGLLFAVRKRTLRPLAAAAATIVSSPLWFLPYWAGFVAPERHGGFESEAAPVLRVLLVFGGFFAVTLLGLLELARERAWPRPALRWLFVLLLLLSGLVSARALFCVLAAGALLAAVLEREPGRSVAFGLAAGAALLGAAADTVFFWDRMNTVFKLYLEAWLFFGVACGAILATQAPKPWRLGPSTALLAVVGLLSAATVVIDTIGAFRTRHVEGPRPTLDGQAYLARTRRGEAEAIRWLQRKIPGSPVLLEAQGPPYREFSRISMNTGLPTVLGWEYHLWQRAHPWAEIRRRADAVGRLYRSLDRSETETLLREYQVALVYVGDIERRQYGPGTEKFDQWQDLFRPVFRSRGVTIYGVALGSPSTSLAPEPPPGTRTNEPAPSGSLPSRGGGDR